MSKHYKITRQDGRLYGEFVYHVFSGTEYSRFLRKPKIAWVFLNTFSTQSAAEAFIEEDLKDTEGWPKYRPVEAR